LPPPDEQLNGLHEGSQGSATPRLEELPNLFQFGNSPLGDSFLDSSGGLRDDSSLFTLSPLSAPPRLSQASSSPRLSNGSQPRTWLRWMEESPRPTSPIQRPTDLLRYGTLSDWESDSDGVGQDDFTDPGSNWSDDRNAIDEESPPTTPTGRITRDSDVKCMVELEIPDIAEGSLALGSPTSTGSRGAPSAHSSFDLEPSFVRPERFAPTLPPAPEAPAVYLEREERGARLSSDTWDDVESQMARRSPKKKRRKGGIFSFICCGSRLTRLLDAFILDVLDYVLYACGRLCGRCLRCLKCGWCSRRRRRRRSEGEEEEDRRRSDSEEAV
jgi:hypothetical protein